jgi:glycosyltransferase involved in cell wall biosynthesis
VPASLAPIGSVYGGLGYCAALEAGRILYLIQHRDYSGAETAQAGVIAADPNALVACPEGSPSSEFAHTLGAHTTDLPFHSMRHSGGRLETVRSFFRGLRGALDMRRALRRHPERTVIFAIGIRGGLLASLAAVGMRRRVMWSVPDRLPPGVLHPLVRLVAAFGSDALVCLSGYIASDLIGRSRRLRDRTTVVHPGVDPERFDPDKAKPGAAQAAVVGHISIVKRTDLAVETAARIVPEEPRFQLEIVGGAQFREENVALERRLKTRVESDPLLREAVAFRGRVSDVAEVLSDCGLLLHVRDDEPFGMVLLEAMAQGLPVVAPASGGPLEIIEEGVTGLLFQPGNVDHAASCVLRLLRDPELARRMGAAARRRVETDFTTVRQVEATRRLLQPAA